MSRSFGYSITINRPRPETKLDDGTKVPAEDDFVSTLEGHNLPVFENVIHYIIGYEGGFTKEAARKNNFRKMKGFKPLTPHLQCAIYFRKSKSFKEVKAIFPRAHIERLRLPYAAAWFYCKKEGCFQERGNFTEAIDHDASVRLKDPAKLPIGYDYVKAYNPLEPVFDNLGAIAKLHYGDSKVGSTVKLGEGGSVTGAVSLPDSPP